MGEELRNGYRFPRMEEFVKGFEYEVYAQGDDVFSIEDFAGWYKYRFEEGLCWRDLEDIERELKNGNIQVKQ